ncbi:unnamed protein product, partial [Ectocarpus sp. 12 AP-2014]
LSCGPSALFLLRLFLFLFFFLFCTLSLLLMFLPLLSDLHAEGGAAAPGAATTPSPRQAPVAAALLAPSLPSADECPWCSPPPATATAAAAAPEDLCRPATWACCIRWPSGTMSPRAAPAATVGAGDPVASRETANRCFFVVTPCFPSLREAPSAVLLPLAACGAGTAAGSCVAGAAAAAAAAAAASLLRFRLAAFLSALDLLATATSGMVLCVGSPNPRAR